MSNLTNAARRALEEARGSSGFRPYGGPQWSLAGRLRREGLLSYIAHSCCYILTREGRDALEPKHKTRGIFIGWSVAGSEISEEPISAREAKPIGATIHVYGRIRKFTIRFRDTWGDDRYPWKLRELRAVGTDRPSEMEEDLDEFSSLREAMREAVKLAKAHA